MNAKKSRGIQARAQLGRVAQARRFNTASVPLSCCGALSKVTLGCSWAKPGASLCHQGTRTSGEREAQLPKPHLRRRQTLLHFKSRVSRSLGVPVVLVPGNARFPRFPHLPPCVRVSPACQALLIDMLQGRLARAYLRHGGILFYLFIFILSLCSSRTVLQISHPVWVS